MALISHLILCVVGTIYYKPNRNKSLIIIIITIIITIIIIIIIMIIFSTKKLVKLKLDKAYLCGTHFLFDRSVINVFLWKVLKAKIRVY